MAFLLDTDTFSHYLRNNATVVAHFEENCNNCYLSAVTARELLKGALATVTDAESPNPRFRVSVPDAYRLLTSMLMGIAEIPLLPFDDQAEALFQSLPKAAHRIGPRDCRIAASAKVRGLTVVTANTQDFERIAESLPGLSLADWTR